ncbi:SDR family NAD(P)-dependent oxidoreductase [Nocardia sp. NPDC046473]|uniref:SDR family NAD(P)-dependent oxidoreductase n=1 Tax=Nocardia sp. NPDC046473 TaxID=3155733 RepID=UPI0033D952C9
MGSLKSNIGHTQAAAGVGGVIKMVQAMRYGVLPKTLNVDVPSSHVDWASGAVSLLTEAQPWPEVDRPRRAGVSSFGISGTNAHVILEQAPDSAVTVPVLLERPVPVPVLLSAGSDAALTALASGLRDRLVADPAMSVADVAYSLKSTRALFAHRGAVVAAERDELLAGLDTLISGGRGGRVVRGVSGGEGKLGVLFTGQGCQRVGMGRELCAAFPVFAEVFDAVCGVLDRHLGVSLRGVIDGDGELLGRTEFAQCAIFAVEVALFGLLRSWGVDVDVVVGHSVGELSAAYVSGVLSLEDAAVLVVARGRLMQRLPEGGVMVAIDAGVDEVVAELVEGVWLAAVNGPSAVVISGDAGPVGEVAAGFAGRGFRTKVLAVSHAFHSGRMEPMLESFAAVVEGLSFGEPSMAVVSTVSGEVDGRLALPGYWVEQVVAPVRFADAVGAAERAGVTRFIELGPDAVLTGLAADCVSGPDRLLVAAMRADRDESVSVVSAVAALWADGVGVDVSALVPVAGRVELPTYPFQHTRFWLDGGSAGGDPVGLGQRAAEHPLLGAELVLPVSGEMVFTGRLSLGTHPWLAEHAVHGTVLVPGTAFVELALHAGVRTGCSTVAELTLELPLILGDEPVDVHVVVAAPDAAGRREVLIYSRADDRAAVEPQSWVRHVRGVLAAESVRPDPATSWHTGAAEPIDLTDVYPELAAAGLVYGPLFQGLRAAWRDGADVLADIALPEDLSGGLAFGIHPALLDSALHAVALGEFVEPAMDSVRLPFAWSDVRRYATGVTHGRLRITSAGPDAVALRLSDDTGNPVLDVGKLEFRAVDADQLARVGGGHRSMFALEWVPAPVGSVSPAAPWAVVGPDELGLRSAMAASGRPGAHHATLADLAETGTIPELVLVSCLPESGDTEAARARGCAHRALELLQTWLSDDRFAERRLVLITGDAVVDPAQATTWGLVRSAQSEHPGRFVLVALDGADTSLSVLPAALAEPEPELAIRDGMVRVPRLVRARVRPRDIGVRAGDTVLVTGATGALGRTVARHLIAEHGVRSLLLVSRRGPAAPGAEALRAELAAAGAEVTVAACDVADRDSLAGLLAAHPVTLVIHTAGVLDDSVITDLTSNQLDRVLRPKVDAALNMDQLIGEDTRLVLFSSAAGTFGNPGQANYAAANAFLDAFAQRRRAAGRPTVSLAWGLWEAGLGAELDDRAHASMRTSGVLPLSDADGMELLDLALAGDEPLLLPVGLDLGAILAAAGSAGVPPLLRGLIRAPMPHAQSIGQAELRQRLVTADDTTREEVVLAFVLERVAAVLGHAAAANIAAEQAFTELGFDSLAAIELRNQLGAATGMTLPTTLVFDYPNAAAVASFLTRQLTQQPDPAAGSDALADTERLVSTLAANPPDAETAARLRKRLRYALSILVSDAGDGEDPGERFDSASDEEMFDFIGKELGIS